MNTGIMCLFSKCFPHAILLHLIAGLPHLTILILIHEYTVYIMESNGKHKFQGKGKT